MEREIMGSVPRGNGLEIFISDGKGLGVRATRFFRTGELIEIAPVIVLDWPYSRCEQLPEPLGRYVYQWHDLLACATGFAMLYNHSYSPNAVYDTTESLGRPALVVNAWLDINPGDEITVNYNGEPGDATAIVFTECDKLLKLTR
jgi:SET domain-containing protein